MPSTESTDGGSTQGNGTKWRKWRKKMGFTGYMTMELFGTMVYVFLGTAGEGLGYLANPSGGRSSLAGFVSFLIWGLALSIGIYIGGGYSGGQLNGAVTVGMATVEKMDRHKMLGYFVAQVFGGLIGSGLAAGFYDSATRQSGYVFSPIPKQGFQLYHFFLTPFLATFLFLLVLSGICDVRNMRIPRAMLGLCIGFTYALISMVFSNCWSGAVIMNPTADAGMRIINALFGNNVFWTEALVAYFGSFLGGACGAVFYTFAFQYHWDIMPIKPPAPAGRVTTTIQPPLKTLGNQGV